VHLLVGVLSVSELFHVLVTSIFFPAALKCIDWTWSRVSFLTRWWLMHLRWTDVL